MEDVRALKHLVVKAKAEGDQLAYLKKNVNKDLVACQLERITLQKELDRANFLDQDSDKIKHLEHCRQLLVSSTISIWKKKVEAKFESMQKEVYSKHDELENQKKKTTDLL